MQPTAALEPIPTSTPEPAFLPEPLDGPRITRRESIKSSLREPMETASVVDPEVTALIHQNRRLQRAVEELSILHDVAKEIGPCQRL